MNMNQYLINELAKHEVIDIANKEKLLEALKEDKINVIDYILKTLKYSQDEVYQGISEIFGYEYYRVINIYTVDFKLLEEFNIMYILQTRVVPFKVVNDSLIVLIDDPFVVNDLEKLKFNTDKEIKIKLVNRQTMNELIDFINDKTKRNEALKEFSDEEKLESVSSSNLDDFLDAPSVQLAESLLKEAINEKASDIHFEPMKDIVRVRFRIDGALKTHVMIRNSMYPSILARYKIMAHLDISERRRPQDGKISLLDDNNNIDFRVSTIPTIYGEKIVIRLYSSFNDTEDLKYLVTNEKDLKMINSFLEAPNGIVLLTGPTGSGKTTTLYSFLKKLNQETNNIITIEDPVENQIEGINQVQVNYKTGLDFATALRSVLRQDPNIVMIGEIRDSETAHIAVQAAITGHLVFSTVHTNDAITTLTRLIDMGVEPYLVSDSIRGAISQRLIRKLCPHCKKEHLVTLEESKYLNIRKNTVVYEPGGCEYCNGTGFIGRIAVFEMLQMTDELRQIVNTNHGDLNLIKETAIKAGFKELYEKTSELVKSGVTSIGEFKQINNIADILHNKELKKRAKKEARLKKIQNKISD